MLHRDRIIALYDLHSWAGLIFGLLIFIICASGALAVFSPELDHWANPSLRTDPTLPQRLDADAALARLAPLAPIRPDRPTTLALPGAHPGLYSLPTPNPAERLNRTYLDAHGGMLTAPREAHMYWYLRHLHVRLMNHWYGRVFIGLIGMTMLISVITGILIHQHPVRGLFRMRWRPGSGMRAFMADLHKWLGVWGMLFHLMIAITGTWLGLDYQLLTPPVALAKYDGDAGQARIALNRQTPPPSAETAPMVALQPLVDRAQADYPGLLPTYIYLENWGRTNATVTVTGNLPYSLVMERGIQMRFSGRDGSLIAKQDSRTQGFWPQVISAIAPLHYGYFGGTWIKLLYLGLGMMPALLALSGSVIWYERRQRVKRAASEQETRTGRAARIVAALFGGGWVALLLGLVLPSLLALAGRPIGSEPMTPLFWWPWIGLATALFCLRSAARIGAVACLLSALLCLLAFAVSWRPPLDGITISVGMAALLCALLHGWLGRMFWRAAGQPHQISRKISTSPSTTA